MRIRTLHESMEKTPDYVAGHARDPRNTPDKGEKKTEAKNAKAPGKAAQEDG